MTCHLLLTVGYNEVNNDDVGDDLMRCVTLGHRRHYVIIIIIIVAIIIDILK